MAVRTASGHIVSTPLFFKVKLSPENRRLPRVHQGRQVALRLERPPAQVMCGVYRRQAGMRPAAHAHGPGGV